MHTINVTLLAFMLVVMGMAILNYSGPLFAIAHKYNPCVTNLDNVYISGTLCSINNSLVLAAIYCLFGRLWGFGPRLALYPVFTLISLCNSWLSFVTFQLFIVIYDIRTPCNLVTIARLLVLVFYNYIRSGLSTTTNDFILQSGAAYLTMMGLPQTEAVSLIEDTLILTAGLIATANCTGKARYVSAMAHVMSYAKTWILSGPQDHSSESSSRITELLNSMLMTFMNDLVDFFPKRTTDLAFERQAGEQEGDDSAESRQDYMSRILSSIAKANTLLKGKFGRSVVKLVLSLVACAMYIKSGTDFSVSRFIELKEKLYVGSIEGSVTLFSELMKAIQFLSTSGYTFMRTGKWDDLFYDPNCATLWSSDLARLKLGVKNFSASGPEIGDTVEELDNLSHSLHDRIEALIRSAKYKNGKNDPILCAMRSDYLSVNADFLIKKAGRVTRPSPFGLLVYGQPAIGKSIFTEILKTLFAKIYDFDLMESGSVYVHNGTSDFMDGLTSNMKMMIIDDIGQFNPKAMAEIDPQLRWLIGIINNVGFTANMADLSEKGKIAFRPDVVLATTNTKDLNARSYFCKDFAIRRRLGVVVTLHVKVKYATEETKSYPPATRILDSTKLDNLSGAFPDIWTVIIERVTCAANSDPTYVNVLTTDNIADAVACIGKLAMTSRDHEKKVETGIRTINTTKLCDECFRPMCGSKACACAFREPEYIPQSGLDDKVHFGLLYGIIYVLSLVLLYSRVTYVYNFVGDVSSQVITRLPLSIVSCLTYYGVISRETYLRTLGRRITSSRPKLIAGMAIAVATGGAMWVMFRLVRTFVLQGGDVPDTKANEDKAENVYKPWGSYVPLSVVTKTHAKTNGNQLFISKLTPLLYHLKVRDPITMEANTVMAFKAGPDTLVTVAHIFEKIQSSTKYLDVEWATSSSKGCLRSFDRSHIFYLPGTDLCSFKVSTTPLAAATITEKGGSSYPENSSQVRGAGCYLGLTYTGEGLLEWDVKINPSSITQFVENKSLPPGITSILGCSDGLIRSTLAEPTVRGDCGTLCLVFLGADSYPQIAGIHAVGTVKDSHTVYANPLTTGKVLALIEGAKSVIQNVYGLESGLESFTPLPRSMTIPAQSSIVETHPKCPTQWMGDQITIPPLQPVGNVVSPDGSRLFRASRSSCVEKAPTHDFMVARGYECDKTSPQLMGYNPPRNNLCGMSSYDYFDSAILMAATKGYFNRIVSGLKRRSPDSIKLGTIDNIDNVNGDVNNRFMQPIVFNTSAGWPYNKPKSEFFPVIGLRDDGITPIRGIDEKIMDDIGEIINHYQDGETANPPFVASLKDEPVSTLKATTGLTRVIYGVPVAFGLVIRRFFLLFVVLFQSNSYLFEGAPGINACSPEWTKLYKHVTYFGENRIIAGDYKAWDKSVLVASIMRCAFDVILSLCFMFGSYSESDKTAMLGIATDICYGTCLYFGTMIWFFGTNMSGHNLTVIVNCIVNSIIMRYAYIQLAVDNGDLRAYDQIVSDFDRDIRLITYGDDNQMGVSPRVPWFNHTALSETFARIGVTYTDALKTGRKFEYETADVTSFLKRGFRFEPTETDGFVRAPLDKASIIRSLMIWKRSATEAPLFQLASIIRSAHREAYQHGKEYFEEIHLLILDIICEFGLAPIFTDSPLPTWDGYTELMYVPREDDY